MSGFVVDNPDEGLAKPAGFAPPQAFVAYYRVSTDRQGRSGLGLDAQRARAAEHVAGRVGGAIVAEFTEVESGKRCDRPQLKAALACAKRHRAVLVFAKLDRLARNVAFIANLMDSGVEFVVCDFPQANRLTLHILAAVAEHEAKQISERTRDALAAAKRRGKRLGNPRPKPASAQAAVVRIEAADRFAEAAAPPMRHLKGQGMSLRGIARELNERKVKTVQGRTWHAETVKAVLERTAPKVAPGTRPESGVYLNTPVGGDAGVP